MYWLVVSNSAVFPRKFTYYPKHRWGSGAKAWAVRSCLFDNLEDATKQCSFIREKLNANSVVKPVKLVEYQEDDWEVATIFEDTLWMDSDRNLYYVLGEQS